MMPYKVTVGHDKSVSDVSRIVMELQRIHKLEIHKDFEFEYHRPEHDFMNNHHVERFTVFYFKDAKHATFFTLKYL